MKTHLQKNEHFSFATLAESRLQIMVCYFSADIHHERSAKRRAAELVYSEALVAGAGSYDRAAFLDALNTLGASITATISDGVFTLQLRGRAAVAQKLLGLVETMMTEPLFSTKELARIKQNLINTIKEQKENSAAIAHEHLRNHLYGEEDRRYVYPENELIAAVATITAKDVRALHTVVKRSHATCSAAGNSNTLSLIEKTLNKLTKQANPSEATGFHQQKLPNQTLLLHSIPSRQNIDFSLGLPVPITLMHPDYVPLSFAVRVLGGAGFASRLMNTVREQQGLTYDISSRLETFQADEQGYFRIGTYFAPDKAVEGLTSTFNELTRLYKNGIETDEMHRHKVIYQTKLALLFDGTARQLNDLHSYHMQKFTLKEISEFKERAATTSLNEVNDAIKRYLDPSWLTVSGAGPISSVKKSLEGFMKTVS